MIATIISINKSVSKSHELVVVESPIQSILYDVLCASISLDDGLSALQGIARDHPEDVELAFEIARAIEEILLRRPALASTKLTEITVRLSFDKRQDLPKMLMLLETRFTNAFRRYEAELLPDIKAIPNLLDILSELSQSIDTAIELNLRPLLPFLSDETLLTLNALHIRGHKASLVLAMHEVHYITSFLINSGMFECAEALLNRLLELARELDMDEFEFELALDEAVVLTELGLYDECRKLVSPLIETAKSSDDVAKLAALTLQLCVNETRDDSVHYTIARSLSDQAISLHSLAIEQGLLPAHEIGTAHLTIASSIIGTGWREGIPEAIHYYKSALEVFDDLETRTPEQSLLLFKILAGLGFAYGILGDYDHTRLALDNIHQAASVLNEIDPQGSETTIASAWCDATIGWVCLISESDEFWVQGIEAFKRAMKAREKLLEAGLIGLLDYIACQVGLGLSSLRTVDVIDTRLLEQLREALAQYIHLFFTDHRAIVEASIAIYDLLWMSHRHGLEIPQRLVNLIDDIVKMLDETLVHDGVDFVVGAKMVVPYSARAWDQLGRVAREISQSNEPLRRVARLMLAFSVTKENLDALQSGLPVPIRDPVDEAVFDADPLLAQYWKGQTRLASAIHQFYQNKDYSTLAKGFHDAAVELHKVETIETDFEESLEFVKATSTTLSLVLFRFARALHVRYVPTVEIDEAEAAVNVDFTEQFNLMVTQDWLGLIKITVAYLQMVEKEDTKSHPYLNAVFSNVARALRMMDDVALIERRILATLGTEMNRRFYVRH